MKYILLDNGHSAGPAHIPADQVTLGKRSPNWEKGVLYEGDFNRDIVKRVVMMMLGASSTSNFLVITPENEDIPLTERARRINKYCTMYGSLNCRLISVHANADESGKGTGGEVWVSRNASDESKRMATIFAEEFKKQFPGEKWRTEVPERQYKVANHYITKHAQCPAILTENGFMTHPKDYLKLWDDSYRQKVAQAHFELIKRIV